MTSMYTATFCSRVIFEICEKLRIANLSMADAVGFIKRMLFGDRDLDFMRWQTVCYSVSLGLIVIGLGAAVMRGRDILNIDFTGGTSVTFQVTDPIHPDELRDILKRILTEDEEGKPVQFTLVRVEKEPADTVYSLVTSIDDESLLAQKLVEGFANEERVRLKTYRVKILSSTASSQQTGAILPQVHYVSTQAEVAPGSAVQVDPDGSNAAPPAADGSEDTAATDDAASPTNASGAQDAEGAQGTGDQSAANAGAVPAARTEYLLEFGGSTDDNPNVPDSEKGARIDAESLKEGLLDAAKKLNIELSDTLVEVYPDPLPENWRPEDIGGYQKWRVILPLEKEQADRVIAEFQAYMNEQPIWLSLSTIGSRVAEEMQQRATAAILLSLIFIVVYIWFRFQRVAYGLAAVVALVHDVIITLGVLALSHWLARPLGFLLIEDFKIGLTEVAAFLTIIGYSLNDTIVVFDRIREVRGRSPRLTSDMVNVSVNQTLSRTLLTSGTTLLTIAVLYIFGGEGIHAFSFALLVGVLVGTYSSIFIASPVLLYLSKRAEQSAQARRAAVATPGR
ncbi:MAG: protein translocase subunit SecF [Planctomycetota bacterium]|nr:MAG: protein translocase subunit SecF [Planctomycetota bacterium]